MLRQSATGQVAEKEYKVQGIEKRQFNRHAVDVEVEVKDSLTSLVGMVGDISSGGVRVEYASDFNDYRNALTPNDVIILTISENIVFPSRIARVFETGYAARFDFSIDAGRPEFTMN